MLRFVFVICSVFLCCQGQYFPDFNFTLSSKVNTSGHWFADVHLEHPDSNPWDVFLTHSTVECKENKFVHIDAKIIAPLIQNMTLGVRCPKELEKATPEALAKLGYELVPEFGYYKVHMDSRNWFDAAETCKEEGTHMLILNSDKEALSVGNLMKKHNIPFLTVLVGIHDRYKEGNWVTVFDEPLKSTGYSKWRKGEPNGGTAENCGYFVYNSTTSLGLSDHLCNFKSEFVCEKEL